MSEKVIRRRDSFLLVYNPSSIVVSLLGFTFGKENLVMFSVQNPDWRFVPVVEVFSLIGKHMLLLSLSRIESCTY